MLKNFLAGGTKCFKALLKDILKLPQLLYYVFLLKGSKLGIKSGSEHMSHLLDSQIRNKKQPPRR